MEVQQIGISKAGKNVNIQITTSENTTLNFFEDSSNVEMIYNLYANAVTLTINTGGTFTTGDISGGGVLYMESVDVTNNGTFITQYNLVFPSPSGSGTISEGVNGLNGTNYIGLGGSLQNYTYIDGNSNSYGIMFYNLSEFNAQAFYDLYFVNSQYDQGIVIDNAVTLGDYEYNYLNTKLIVDGYNSNIFTFYQNNYNGLKFDFTNHLYQFGDIESSYNGGRITINDDSKQIYSSHFNSDYGFTSDYGLFIDWSNGLPYTVLGDLNTNYGGLCLSINNIINRISSVYNYGEYGFIINFELDQYLLGDFNEVTNGNYLMVSNESNEIFTASMHNEIWGERRQFGFYVHTTDYVTSLGDYFDYNNGTFILINDASEKLCLSGNLLSGSSGGIAPVHLMVNIGGTDYKIELRNP